MRDAIEAWAQHQLTHDLLAVNSVTGYRTQLQLVADLLLPPDIVKPADIRAVIKHARGRGLGDKSVNVLLAALKSFYRWCAENSAAIEALRTVRGPRAKTNARLPRALTEDQCFDLLAAAAHRNSWLGKRDVALFTLIWATGLRVSEALKLTIADAGAARDVLRVWGKGDKERMVPVLPAVWSAIDDYLIAIPSADLDDEHPLFVSENLVPLGDRDVRRIFELYAKRLGLPKDASPHSLRHSFATHMLNAGANLIDLKELLGHESVSTTAIYAHVATDRLVQIYESAHPRAELAAAAV